MEKQKWNKKKPKGKEGVDFVYADPSDYNLHLLSDANPNMVLLVSERGQVFFVWKQKDKVKLIPLNEGINLSPLKYEGGVIRK